MGKHVSSPVSERRIDIAQALIEQNGKVLVVRNHEHDDGIAGWGFPGGRVEPGETFAEAAAREVREETGVTIEVGTIVAVGEWLHETHALFVVFAARILAGYPTVQGDDVAVDLQWVEPDEADRLMPWYPGGVRALLAGGAPLYYVERTA